MEHNTKTLEDHLKGIKNVGETVVFRRPSVVREKLTGESVGLTEGLRMGRSQEFKKVHLSFWPFLSMKASTEEQSNMDG